MLANLNITNETADVAEVQTITIGSAVEGETYAAVFGFASASVVAGSGDTPSNVATALAGEINTVAGSIVTASPSSNTVVVTADVAGRSFDMSVTGPSTNSVVTTPAALAREIDLTAIAFGALPEGSSLSKTIEVGNLTENAISVLKGKEKRGELSVNPPIDALLSGVVEGDLSVGAGETVTIEGLRVEGDVVIAATGTLLANDCFFAGDVDNSAGGTATLTGGRVIGTKSGTVTHTQGDIGV